jgi:O-antigen/teichoic acid export membrane protein
MFSSLFHFSLYSLLGNAANVGAQQGVNLLVNSFTNVAVNAAIGVSNQLSRGIYSFITNFQIAFNPILVKMYARNELSDL